MMPFEYIKGHQNHSKKKPEKKIKESQQGLKYYYLSKNKRHTLKSQVVSLYFFKYTEKKSLAFFIFFEKSVDLYWQK
jgi:hypothetical protein